MKINWLTLRSQCLSAGSVRRSVLAVAALLLLPVAGLTQETTSAIRGKIYDDAGATVAGADVVVEDTRTGVIRRYSSNNTGSFYASRLPVGGPYRVTVGGTKSVRSGKDRCVNKTPGKTTKPS